MIFWLDWEIFGATSKQVRTSLALAQPLKKQSKFPRLSFFASTLIIASEKIVFLKDYLVIGWKEINDDLLINSRSGMLVKKKYPWMKLPWRVLHPTAFDQFPQLSLERFAELDLCEINIAYKTADTASDGADDTICRQRRKGNYVFYNNYLDRNFQNFTNSLRSAANEVFPRLRFIQDYDGLGFRRFTFSGRTDELEKPSESIRYLENEARKFTCAEKSILNFTVEDNGEGIFIRGYEQPIQVYYRQD